MTGPGDVRYPPPDPRRVERALSAMHARRARLRRYRIIGVSGALVILVAVFGAVYAGVSPSGAGRGIHVEGGTSTTLTSTPGTTKAPIPTTTAPTTTTNPEPASSTSSSTSSTTAAVVGTEVITYQPFTATGAVDPALHVVGQATGTCLGGESSRSYRCFGGTGAIYDPCFAAPGGTSEPLVCPNDPATNDVTTFAASSVTAPSSTIRAWAIQLSTGEICRYAFAATMGLGPFSCQTYGSPSALADCLEPQSARPWWTTECQPQESTTSPLASYQVTKVWF